MTYNQHPTDRHHAPNVAAHMRNARLLRDHARATANTNPKHGVTMQEWQRMIAEQVRCARQANRHMIQSRRFHRENPPIVAMT